MFPFCDSDRNSKTRDEQVEDNMKCVEANDAFSICMLADSYYHGLNGFQQDQIGGVPQKMSFFQMVRKSFLSDQ